MKGVTHYFFAAALVSLIPMAMSISAAEKAFIIVFGAIAGILPDYIDFKIVRFFWRVDEEILPEWPIPDAQRIAEKIASLIDKAWYEKRTINVQIHTIKTGPNTWRRWYIHLDPDKKKVIVGIGPIQTFSGRAYAKTVDDIPPDKRKGEASFTAPLKYDYKDRTIKVSILSGPMVAFVPRNDHVEVVFLPWHRHMSHSFTLAGILSLWVFIFAFLITRSLTMTYLYTEAFFVGFVSHIISDHLGYMGSNFFWPITQRRTPGLKLTESMDPYANFAMFWGSITVLFWQMNSVVPNPIVFPWTMEIFGVEVSLFYWLVVFLMPIVAVLVARHFFWRQSRDPYLDNLLGEEVGEI